MYEDSGIDLRKGLLEYQATEEITDAVNANLESQADPNNGFTAERTMRKIADIPVAVFHPWARKIGYYHMDHLDRWRAMRIFLAEHPEYRAVERLKNDTANQSHIIIK